jgi:Ca2+-binding EF-hand superfamily protein
MQMKTKRFFLGLGLAGALALPAVALAWPDGEGHDGRRARMMEKFDANGDGTLDDAERAAARTFRQAMHAQRKAEMLAKYDADKDGTLSDAERAQARQDRMTERFKMLDTNKDNILSFEEFAAGAEKMGHHRGAFGRGGFRK